jgi:hypothetical protein
VFNKSLNNQTFFFITIAQTIRWLRSSNIDWTFFVLRTVIRINDKFALRRCSPWINIAIRMSSFFAVIRIHVIYTHTYTHIHTYIHTYIHTHIHTYIHTKSYLCTLASTTQSWFPRGARFWQNDKNKERRITIYYIGNRTSQVQCCLQINSSFKRTKRFR